MSNPQVSAPEVSASQVSATKANIHRGVIAAAGILAAMASALILSVCGDLVVMPEEFQERPQNPNADYLIREYAAFQHMYTSNYAVFFALAGGLIGAALGFSGSTRNRLTTAMASALGGVLAGAAGGWLLGLITARNLNQNSSSPIVLWGITIEPLVQTTVLQCAIWAVLGIGIGCGWTAAISGFQKIATGVQGGFIGGLLAGMASSIMAAVLFPNANAFLILPLSMTERLVWAAICGAGLCGGLVVALNKSGMLAVSVAENQ